MGGCGREEGSRGGKGRYEMMGSLWIERSGEEEGVDMSSQISPT